MHDVIRLRHGRYGCFVGGGGGGSLRRLDKAHTAGQGEKRKRADVFEMLFVFSFSSFERESVIYAEK